jgi:hypothetical protein
MSMGIGKVTILALSTVTRWAFGYSLGKSKIAGKFRLDFERKRCRRITGITIKTLWPDKQLLREMQTHLRVIEEFVEQSGGEIFVHGGSYCPTDRETTTRRYRIRILANIKLVGDPYKV